MNKNVRNFGIIIIKDGDTEFLDLNLRKHFFELNGDLGISFNNIYTDYSYYSVVSNKVNAFKQITGNIYFGYNTNNKEAYKEYDIFYNKIINADHLILQYWNLNNFFYKDIDLVDVSKTEIDKELRILKTQATFQSLSNWYEIIEADKIIAFPEDYYSNKEFPDEGFVGSESDVMFKDFYIDGKKMIGYKYDNHDVTYSQNVISLEYTNNSNINGGLSRFYIEGNTILGTKEVIIEIYQNNQLFGKEIIDISKFYGRFRFDNIYGKINASVDNISVYNNRDYNQLGIIGIPSGDVYINIEGLDDYKLVFYKEKAVV